VSIDPDADERPGRTTGRVDAAGHRLPEAVEGGARDPTGRNGREVRGDRERADAEADPSLARGGRADREAIDPCPCPVYQGIGHSPLDGGCGSSRQARPGRRLRLQSDFHLHGNPPRVSLHARWYKAIVGAAGFGDLQSSRPCQPLAILPFDISS